MTFRNSRIVITGAASGIGAATARRFAREGARLVLVDIEDLGDTLAAVAGAPVLGLNHDVRVHEQVHAMMDEALDFLGGLDVLVNNAGRRVQGATGDQSDEDWLDHFATDVHPIHFAVQAARAALAESRGCVVNTTSVGGLGGDAGMAAYNAANGAAIRLTNSLALELAPLGIRVNSVCPTLTETPMASDILHDPDRLSRFTSAIPLRRLGRPEEIAAAIAFLAGDEASFVTGVALPVDGGISAGSGQPRLE